MISIHFDPNVLIAQRVVNTSSNYINEALNRLTTGLRINSAADDPAGYYQTETLNSKLRGLVVANQNIADGINFMTTASSSLFEMNDIVVRLKTLAQIGASTIDSSQREAMQKEGDAFLEELFKLKNNSEFNGINVFGADKASNYAISILSAYSPPPRTSKHLPQLP